jgi:hypothetical protein
MSTKVNARKILSKKTEPSRRNVGRKRRIISAVVADKSLEAKLTTPVQRLQRLQRLQRVQRVQRLQRLQRPCVGLLKKPRL